MPRSESLTYIHLTYIYISEKPTWLLYLTNDTSWLKRSSGITLNECISVNTYCDLAAVFKDILSFFSMTEQLSYLLVLFPRFFAFIFHTIRHVSCRFRDTEVIINNCKASVSLAQSVMAPSLCLVHEESHNLHTVRTRYIQNNLNIDF